MFTLPTPKTKTEEFQLYKLAMLQFEIESAETVIGKNEAYRKRQLGRDEFRRGKNGGWFFKALTDEDLEKTRNKRNQYVQAFQKEVTESVLSKKGLVPQTHALYLELYGTKTSEVDSTIQSLQAQLEDTFKKHDIPIAAASIFKHRDDIKSVKQKRNHYYAQVSFAGAEPCERAIFDFVKTVISEPGSQIEPNIGTVHDHLVDSIFSERATYEDAVASTSEKGSLFQKLELIFPCTPNHLAEDLELGEQSNIQAFISEHEHKYYPLFAKYLEQEFAPREASPSLETEPALSSVG